MTGGWILTLEITGTNAVPENIFLTHFSTTDGHFIFNIKLQHCTSNSTKALRMAYT